VFSDVANGNIRRKIALMGILLIVAPLLVLGVAGWVLMQRVGQSATISGVRTSNAHLVDLTRNLVDLCRSYQQASIDKLKSGRSILDAVGSISLKQDRLLAWRAKNETTGETTELRLPVMSAGTTNFLPLADFGGSAPVVDQIEKLNGTPATIFQRMNERGDMLRICTSVKSETGARDIGSYIPVDSAGQPAEALRDVLAGQPYIGRAFVSNIHYLTAYQPLQDGTGKVVGMLSTVLAEEQIVTNIRSLATRGPNADRVALFAWRASGADRGAALIMLDKTAEKSWEGQDLWNRKDSSGRLYVQEICSRAVTLPAGEIAEDKYQNPARVGGVPRTIIARFAYVPELDWVVGYAQPEADFMAGAVGLQALLDWGMWLLLGVGLAGTGVAVRIWIKFSENLAGKLSRLLTNVTADAKELSVAAVALSAEAKRGTGKAGAEDILAKAARTAAEITLAIRHIDASSDSVIGVMEALDQIAFATNMLAVNSALEASHAEGSGQPVAGIAEELRKLAARCREAARETQTELEQSRIEMQRGNEEVLEMVRSQPQPDDENTALQRQAENLVRLAEVLDLTVERMSKYLEH